MSSSFSSYIYGSSFYGKRHHAFVLKLKWIFVYLENRIIDNLSDQVIYSPQHNDEEGLTFEVLNVICSTLL